MRRLAILLGFAAAALAEETKDLDQPPVSPGARRTREQAQALWEKVAPLWEQVRTKKAVPPAEAAAALPVLEQAVEVFERSLREEWNREANRMAGDAVRAWWKLRALVPPEAPAEDAARQKAEKAAAVERKREVRDFIMKYAAERRATSLFRTCPKCEGRGECASPCGDKRECVACSKRGRLLDRDAIIAARWIRWSPLHRAQARHEQQLNTLLRGSAPDAQRDRFAPYIRSVTIKEVEDHDTWVRVKAQDQIQPTLTSNKTEKADVTYVLLRVGKVWYLYDEHADRDLLDLTEESKTAVPAPG
jgi:hypothetical protein